ncbi:MAG: hypothetical protein U1E65_35220 [Myxococcota bacterium]
MLLVSACGSRFDLDLTAFRASKTVVAIAHDAARISQALVMTSSGGLDQSFDLRVSGLTGPSLTVLGSTETAAKLRLFAGPLLVDPDQGEHLPAFQVIRTRALQGGAWSEPATLPAPLGETRFKLAPIVDPCPKASPRVFELDSTAPVGWAGTMTSSAVVATQDGEFFTLDRDLHLTTYGSVPFYFWGLGSVDGQLLIGNHNCVHRAGFREGRPELGPIIHCTPTAGQYRLVTGPHGFVIVTEGVITFHTTTASVTAHYSEPVDWGPATLLPTGVYVLAPPFDDGALRFVDPEQTWREVIDPSVGIRSVNWVEGVGLLAGDTSGKVYLRSSPGHWDLVGDTGFYAGVDSFWPIPGGFLALGGTADGVVFFPGHGFCPGAAVSAGPAPSVTRLGSGYVFVGVRFGSKLAITWADFGLDR